MKHVDLVLMGNYFPVDVKEEAALLCKQYCVPLYLSDLELIRCGSALAYGGILV